MNQTPSSRGDQSESSDTPDAQSSREEPVQTNDPHKPTHAGEPAHGHPSGATSAPSPLRDGQPEVPFVSNGPEIGDLGPMVKRGAIGEAPRLVIITGMSGAGRRTAAHVMEDLGWYVVDNLPPALLPNLLELSRQHGLTHIGVVVDVRSHELFSEMGDMFETLQREARQVEILFLEADDDVIVRRQESSRRPLPMQGTGRLLDGIARERARLSPFRASADLVIDTSRLNVHQLAERVAHAYSEDSDALQITVLSFGFKHGLPVDADLAFDMRFLPNPHWEPELRPMSGLDRPVSAYVLAQPAAQKWLNQIDGLLDLMAPGYVHEGKRQVTIAVGCTGGKHRSVAMSEALGRRLEEQGLAVAVMHRDLGLE